MTGWNRFPRIGRRRATSHQASSGEAEPSFAEDAGVEYADFIAAELTEARATKASLEQRAIGLVSASGVFVTVLFGLIAFLTRSDSFALPGQAEPPLYASLALFGFAAVLALMANAPGEYQGVNRGEPDDEYGLENIVRSRWGNPRPIARRRVAMTRIVILAAYKAKNTRKGRLLIGATAAEALAIVFLGVTVAFIIGFAD